MKHIEQICPQEGPAYRKWLKRVMSRTMRKMARAQLEDAPTKHRYRGYSM